MSDPNFILIKKVLHEKVRLNESLSNHTTLGIGGPAKLFSEAKTEEDLKKYIKLAIKYNIPYLVIGGGSDLLVSDDGFDGFVIKNLVEDKRIIGKKVKVKSGTKLQDLINFCIDKGFAGCEKMSGIPGTLGGAIHGNAGAYGQAISDYIVNVRSFNGKRIKTWSKAMCKFDYRESIFKKNTEVILEADFEFEKGNYELLKKVSLDTISLRLQKYPYDIKCPGSFYKNIVANTLSKKILAKIPNDKIVFGKIPAGYLLETVGAKGQQIGSVKFADYHANLVINLGHGSASDYIALTTKFAKLVDKKYTVKLIPEVQLVGFKDEK